MHTTHLLKKFKAYEKEALLPLYHEHATYLLRIIKTAEIQTQILERIDTYLEVATCHEVAINSLSDLELETHQNRLGKEAEYTNHEKAKNVGRDLRVRLIWALIRDELEADISLAKYDVYENLSDKPDGRIYCPICGQSIGEYIYEKIYDGEHADGTIDYHYSIVNFEASPCDHLVLNDNPNDFLYYDDEFEWLVKSLKSMGVYLSDFESWLQVNEYDVSLISESDNHPDSNGNEEINYFSADIAVLNRALRWFYAEQCIENDVEYEE
jgi:hypothetical protein